MAKQLYTEAEVRKIFLEKTRGRTLADIGNELNMKPQNVHAFERGMSPSPKILMWLGFERLERVYRRAK